MEQKRVSIITMGCSKNLVDSERVMRMLSDAGFSVDHDSDDINGADEVIINTCGFIGDAKEESINMILECAKARTSGRIGGLTVMGCLSQRYRDELAAEIPEVDRWYGKFDWVDVARDLAHAHPSSALWERILTTPPHHAYIKISEGCNRFCAFCAIPLITGRHHSRPADEIVSEVQTLTRNGVREFNIIAQDLSSYGQDLGLKGALASLLERLAAIEGVHWLRLHYAYPADFPYEILPVMATHDNICKYLDIALQHSSDKVLANMRRHITRAETVELLARIRREVPGIHIRTTLMVGFPGEGEAEFEDLLDFVREQRFERMGAFAYCEEEGTYGATHYRDNIPEQEKQRRLDILMEEQQEISAETNLAKVGQTFEVVVDSIGDEYVTCRSQWDSPEVDPEILIPRTAVPADIHPGMFVNVTITEALPYDLIGVLA